MPRSSVANIQRIEYVSDGSLTVGAEIRVVVQDEQELRGTRGEGEAKIEWTPLSYYDKCQHEIISSIPWHREEWRERMEMP